ncbi:hypothetical protein [Kurthia senegalensis]|uniref:hypothetical protein n=1 Tax=Kurthia senegalensis TaxID=1033740 RepID=UPI0002886A3F|nr:hypothetical protein [Kurthia senegalensis]
MNTWHTYLLFFASMMLIIFGGTFLIRYTRTGDVLVDQLLGVFVGIVLLIGSIFWKIKAK